jgi:hypothetical protein
MTMAIDWKAMTDQEISEETAAGKAEKERRFVLVSASTRVDSINAEYLKAEGTASGDPWRPPQGAHDAYPRLFEVTHNGKDWSSLVAGNVWEPGVSGWQEKTPDGSPPAWIQPTGAHDAYQSGDMVTHNDEVYISEVDANTWEPGVYGWFVAPNP